MSRKASDTDLTGEYSVETSVVEAQPEPVSVEQTQSKPLRLVYVGPNIPGGILQRFQVFKGGYPPHCKDLFEKIPEIKELFVPVEGLEAMRRKTEEPGTNEARIFYVVQKAVAKGVK
jgi:hypothetical protein